MTTKPAASAPAMPPKVLAADRSPSGRAGLASLPQSGPQRRQHHAGAQRRRTGRERGEPDDAQQVLPEPAAHADVREPIGQGDEQPPPADAGDRRADQCAARERGRRAAPQAERRQRRPGREGQHEDQHDGGERVDRVVQDLREQPRP